MLSFTRGRVLTPTRGTERGHGGTDDTDITHKFHNFWELNDCIIIVSLTYSTHSSEQELTQEAMLLSRSHVYIPPAIFQHT